MFSAIACCFLLQFQAFGEEEASARLLNEFNDPRLFPPYEWIREGEDVTARRDRRLSNSILIISWQPDPEGNYDSYQISGIPGYHSRETVEDFLEAFCNLEGFADEDEPVNILLAGNNWAAGIPLRAKLLDLSKDHKFSVFYAGGAFRRANLIKEPESRLAMIEQAFRQATDNAQTDTARPATRPGSSLEGGDDSQSEVEERSR